MQIFKQRALVVALAAVGVASINAVYAQQAPAAPKVEKIEVTGSNIKRVDAETASPIQVITADEIRRSGKQTVTDLLRELPINAAGGLTELTGSGSFSAGAASASLRGLGSSATLVLLNGRRIAPYGLADPNFGQAGAVNLNAIPLNAIERIEILKDGASAIYGSEAIAGVINIILRKDYKGAQIGATANANKDGDYRNGTVTGSFGVGDLAKDRYNFFGNVEIYRQTPTKLIDTLDFLNRQQFRDVYGTGLISSSFSPFLTYITNATGAVVASPGPSCPAANIVPWNFNGFNLTGAGGASGNVCLFDNISPQIITPKIERASIFARGTIDLSATTQLFAEGSFVKSSTFFAGQPSAVGFGGIGTTFNPSTGRLNPPISALVIGHPNNPFARVTTIRGRLNSVGPQDNEVESKTTRVLGGFKAVLGKYDFESALLYNLTEQDTTNFNAIRYDRLARAFGYAIGANAVGNPILVPDLAGGTFNFANPNSGSVTADSLRINARDNAKSSFTILDAKLSGEVGQLSGGAVGLAAGVEYRKEDRNVKPDAEKIRGNIAGRGVASAVGKRNVSTVFGELVMPFAKNLEVQVAARYDRYSDFGNSLTPKIAAAWTPISGVKFRSSYATGFRAPSLTEITRSATSGFFNGVDDPRRCLRPTVTIGCGLSLPGLIVANPNVKPEKATTASAGFVWDVSNTTSLSVDYFAIARRSEITFLGLTEILNNEGSTDPRYANRVIRDPANTNAAVVNDPGAILFVNTGFDNLGETRVKGIDIDARHRISLGENGRLGLVALLTHYIDQRGSGAAGAPLVSYSGFRNAPEWRGQFSANWSVGNWNSTGIINVLGPMKSFSNPESNVGTALAAIRDCGNTAGSYLGVCTIPTYVTIDASTEYSGFKNWRISFVARNLANARPSIDPLARPFNTTWYQPQGLNFSLGARYTFY